MAPRILDRITGPQDLKNLAPDELTQLSKEIREELVATVTNNGGHLSSNLGVVELTIALHRVFDTPNDKIIWDVGHQAYVHKLLTGRRESFSTIRRHGGISGFPERSESPHDAFGAGHASTSISAALGIAAARDLAGKDFSVVAVIGDGSLTGGMAFEGLNNAGHMGARLIVILNDNAMAISPNVGALSRALSNVRLDPRYHKAQEDARNMIQGLPLGTVAWKAGMRLKSGVKGLLFTMQIWEQLGFKYIGPIDGHDMAHLEEALTRARNYRGGPIFLHIITTKGKGYDPAETDNIKFHGISGKAGKTTGPPPYSDVFGQALTQIMRENPKVVAITAAMKEGTGLTPVAKEFTGRFYDVGICEQHAVTFAAGLATQGFIPVVAIYSTFLQRALDQIVHDVCIQNLPVVFAIDRAGIVGEDGKTHQGILDLSYLSCIPNMVAAAPADEDEMRQMLYTAVKAGCPVAIRYPRGPGPGAALDREFREIPIGKAEVIRPGDDVAIIAIGSAVTPCLEAARLLEEKGVSCAVVNARFVKPLDSDLIRSMAARTKRLVTVEENVVWGGFGSAVLGAVSDMPGVRVERIGLPDSFIEHGAQGLLRAKYGMDAQGIAKRILAAFPVVGSAHE